MDQLPKTDEASKFESIKSPTTTMSQQPQQIPRPIQSEMAQAPTMQTVMTTVQSPSPQQKPLLVPGTSQPSPINSQIRPHEYLVLLAPNPRQPGVQGIRYPIQTMISNQPNILQGNTTLLRGINASQLIRAQTSSGVMQPQTSQGQTTTIANIQGRHVQIPFTGPRGQITLANGQTLMPSTIPLQRHPMMNPRATILQQPMIRGVAQPGMGVQPVIPTSQSLGLGVQTSLGQAQVFHQTPTALAPSQMTPDDVLAKGTSFFSSLLAKMTIKSKKTTVTNLIQALVDSKKSSEEFATALQKELNSGQQTQLVPFLDILMPHLRQALTSGIIKLAGIKPPPPPIQETNTTPIVSTSPVVTTPTTEDKTPSTSSPNKVQSSGTTAKKKKVPLPPGQKSAYAIKKEAREAKKKEKESLAAQVKVEKVDEKKEVEKTEKPVKPKTDKPKRQEKQKKQEKQLESLSSALRDDDDVNDVAAMGGVNLAEESQRIMASGAELVGTQIRSCKDEPFLDTKALSSRIARIAKEYNLSEPSKDVVTIISHATQERLKNMVERLGVLAEHRNENLARNTKYEISTDIKGQMKFLADLDRIEKRRYEEQERELLLRVAKSRSKVEDPEQQRLRQKAKDMQRAEQEEVRQREANETALLAIGPRKKLKTTSSVSSFSQSSSLNDVKIGFDTRGDTIRRPTKRVNMRDLMVLLELDRTHLDRLIKITAR